MRVRLSQLAVGSAVFMQACGPGSSATREGLGIDSLPDLQVVERTVLGGFNAEGPDALGKVNSITVLPGLPVIAVTDGSLQEVLLFNLDGQPLGSAGGRGGGPGEFRAIRQVGGTRGGQLNVWDVQQSRLTTFRPDLELVDTHRADLDPVEQIFPEFVGFLADGGFILRDSRDGMGMRDVPEGIRQDTVRLYHYSATGEFRDTVAVLLEEPKWFRNRDGSWGWEDLIFGRELMTLVVGDEVWVGSTAGFSFTRYGSDGQVRGKLELIARSRLASAEDIEHERERRIGEVHVRRPGTTLVSGPAGMEDLMVQMAEAQRAAIREVPSSDTLPAYDLAVSGIDGPVLLREYPLPRDDTVRWVVLDNTGAPHGKVRLSREAEIGAVAPGLIVVLEQDEYDVPVIRILEYEGADGSG